jgi:hypothetical protein
MAMKTLNPKETFEWSYSECPETVFTYQAASGPNTSMSQDSFSAKVINKYVLYVTNIEIDGVEVAKWMNDGSLSFRLPFPIANLLSTEILMNSLLSVGESKNSNVPSGSPTSEEPDGTVTNV